MINKIWRCLATIKLSFFAAGGCSAGLGWKLGMQQPPGGGERGGIRRVVDHVVQFCGIAGVIVQLTGHEHAGVKVPPLGVTQGGGADAHAHRLRSATWRAVWIRWARMLGEGGVFDPGLRVIQHRHEADAFEAGGGRNRTQSGDGGERALERRAHHVFQGGQDVVGRQHGILGCLAYAIAAVAASFSTRVGAWASSDIPGGGAVEI